MYRCNQPTSPITILVLPGQRQISDLRTPTYNHKTGLYSFTHTIQQIYLIDQIYYQSQLLFAAIIPWTLSVKLSKKPSHKLFFIIGHGLLTYPSSKQSPKAIGWWSEKSVTHIKLILIYHHTYLQHIHIGVHLKYLFCNDSTVHPLTSFIYLSLKKNPVTIL